MLSALWVLIVASGVVAMIRYDSTPAPAHQVATVWPDESAILFDASRPVLIMAIHPQCSCTRASLNELARMLPRIQGHPRIVVLLLGTDGNRYESQVKDMHLEALEDRQGMEAARFGFTTSGEVAVYGRDRALLYSGGLTGARGHEGDNFGEASALAALEHSGFGPSQNAPVFGCELGVSSMVRSENAQPQP
jgi:hypothetical protein